MTRIFPVHVSHHGGTRLTINCDTSALALEVALALREWGFDADRAAWGAPASSDATVYTELQDALADVNAFYD